MLSEKGDYDKPNSDLVGKIDSVIKRIVNYGQAVNKDDFRLYVTGYGQFFNDQDAACNDVTFARTANPKNDGKKHVMMTTKLRGEANAMSRLLNKLIQEAVDKNKDDNVKYIDIDSMLDGHRFCEPGIKEPDQKIPNAYFWHYPYTKDDSPSDKAIDYLNKVAEDSVSSLARDAKTTRWGDYLNDFWSKVDEKELLKSLGASDEADTAVYKFWSDTIGWRARIFHPQLKFHREIYQKIIKQYLDDTKDADAAGKSTGDLDTSAITCDTNALGGVPFNILLSENNNAPPYHAFCKDFDASTDLTRA